MKNFLALSLSHRDFCDGGNLIFCGPKGQESLAQALPWVLVYKPEFTMGIPLIRISPEGAA
jgi:hypothetical protein